jgi:hypothetical protein
MMGKPHWDKMDDLLTRVGITMDDSLEDRLKFDALTSLMGYFGEEVIAEVDVRSAPDSSSWWKEYAEEFLVG